MRIPAMRAVLHAGAVAVAMHATVVGAQGAWKPEKPVEIVVNTAPGSGPDKNAKLMQKLLQELKRSARIRLSARDAT